MPHLPKPGETISLGTDFGIGQYLCALSLRSFFKYGHFPPKPPDVGILHTEQRPNYLVFLPYMLRLVPHLPLGISVHFAGILSSSKGPRETTWPRG